LIVQFLKPESVEWAVKRYNGALVNGRKLSVNKFKSVKGRGKSSKFKTTNLEKINETNADGDEDENSGGEKNLENSDEDL
jgi:RNA recognition motif-containing protein